MTALSSAPPAAEVQAHAGLQSRADMEQLREQLLHAFRQQMDIRKSLMELENSNMEIQIDKSKHLLIITESAFQICEMIAAHNYNNITE